MQTQIKKYVLIIACFLLQKISAYDVFSLINSIQNQKTKALYDFSTSSSENTTDLNAPIAISQHASTLYATSFHTKLPLLAIAGAPASGIAARIYSISTTGTALYSFSYNDIAHSTTLYTAAWHPNKNYLFVAGGADTNNITGKLFYLDETPKKITLMSQCSLTHGNTVYAAAWSPDGNFLAVGGGGTGGIDHVKTYSFDETFLWELPNAKITYANTSGEVYGVSWSSDGKYIASCGQHSGSNNGQVTFFNPDVKKTSSLPWAYFNHGTHLYSVAFHPHTNRLIFAGANSGGTTTRLYRFTGSTFSDNVNLDHGSTVRTISWAPDGAYFATGGDNSILKMYAYLQDSVTPLTNGTYNIGANSIQGTAWANDNTSIALTTTGATNNIRLLQLQESVDFTLKKQRYESLYLYKLVQNYSTDLSTYEPLIRNTSNYIKDTRHVVLSSLTTVTTLNFSITPTHNPQTSCIDWHPSGKYFALNTSDTILTFQFNDEKLIQMGSSLTSWANQAERIQWSPSGSFLFTRNQTHDMIYQFNPAGLTLTASLSPASFHDFAWDPSESFILTQTNGTMVTEHLQSVSLSRTSIRYKDLSTTFLPPFNTLAFSKNGNYAAFARSIPKDRRLTLCALPSINFYSQSYSFSIPVIDKINSIDFHPTRNLFAIAGEKNTFNNITIACFSTEQIQQPGQSLANLPGCSMQAGNINKIAWSPSGKYLAAACQTAPHLRIYRLYGDSLVYEAGLTLEAEAKGISWSPDETYLAVCSWPNPITNSNLSVRILKPEYLAIHQTHTNLLVETSNAVASLTNPLAAEITLATENQSAINALIPLMQQNSNLISSQQDLIINISNTIANTLLENYQAIKLAIDNSYAILAAQALALTNSNLLNLRRFNSNAIVSFPTTLVANNNIALNGLLVETSNALAGLLVRTSEGANAIENKLAPLDTIDTGLSHVHINSSSVTLTYNLNLSTDHQLFVHTSGVVNGNGHSITFAKGSGTCFTVDPGITTTFQNVIFKDYNDAGVSLGAGSSFLFGHNSRIELSESQDLLRTWSFAGTTQLNGLGNSLTLNTGPFYLATLDASIFQLLNLNLLNVQSSNIRCTNNNSRIIFQDVIMNLYADYTYNTGAITIQNDLTLRGSSIFNWTTQQQITINSASQLMVDGINLYYQPGLPNITSRNRLVLTDSSSKLYFKNSKFYGGSNGLWLTKGTLIVDGIMTLQPVSASWPWRFGDGNPANDLIIKILPGATFRSTGYLDYYNVN